MNLEDIMLNKKATYHMIPFFICVSKTGKPREKQQIGYC